jgi:hypothetical protein
MDEINSQPKITIQSLDGSFAPGFAGSAALPKSQPASEPAVAVQENPLLSVPEIFVPEQSAPEVTDRVSYADAKIQEIEVAKIAPNPFQPRKTFDPAALRELADSIKEHGVIQPLVVTKTPVGYELVAGKVKGSEAIQSIAAWSKSKKSKSPKSPGSPGSPGSPRKKQNTLYEFSSSRVRHLLSYKPKIWYTTRIYIHACQSSLPSALP